MTIASTELSDRQPTGEDRPPRMAYSVQETADRLGVCQASVYRALKRGQLEAVTLGGRRLIPARSINKLLSANAA